MKKEFTQVLLDGTTYKLNYCGICGERLEGALREIEKLGTRGINVWFVIWIISLIAFLGFGIASLLWPHNQSAQMSVNTYLIIVIVLGFNLVNKEGI